MLMKTAPHFAMTAPHFANLASYHAQFERLPHKAVMYHFFSA